MKKRIISTISDLQLQERIHRRGARVFGPGEYGEFPAPATPAHWAELIIFGNNFYKLVLLTIPILLLILILELDIAIHKAS